MPIARKTARKIYPIIASGTALCLVAANLQAQPLMPAEAPWRSPSFITGTNGSNGTTGGTVLLAQAQAQPSDTTPVGQAPESQSRPPEIAPIFEQPGVLTAPGRYVLEPSLQYGYSSSNRIALVGYTVIPALLIGLVDVREVKRNTTSAALAARFGVTRRLELYGQCGWLGPAHRPADWLWLQLTAARGDHALPV